MEKAGGETSSVLIADSNKQSEMSAVIDKERIIEHSMTDVEDKGKEHHDKEEKADVDNEKKEQETKSRNNSSEDQNDISEEQSQSTVEADEKKYMNENSNEDQCEKMDISEDVMAKEIGDSTYYEDISDDDNLETENTEEKSVSNVLQKEKVYEQNLEKENTEEKSVSNEKQKEKIDEQNLEKENTEEKSVSNEKQKEKIDEQNLEKENRPTEEKSVSNEKQKEKIDEQNLEKENTEEKNVSNEKQKEKIDEQNDSIENKRETTDENKNSNENEKETVEEKDKDGIEEKDIVEKEVEMVAEKTAFAGSDRGTSVTGVSLNDEEIETIGDTEDYTSEENKEVPENCETGDKNKDSVDEEKEPADLNIRSEEQMEVEQEHHETGSENTIQTKAIEDTIREIVNETNETNENKSLENDNSKEIEEESNDEKNKKTDYEIGESDCKDKEKIDDEDVDSEQDKDKIDDVDDENIESKEDQKIDDVDDENIESKEDTEKIDDVVLKNINSKEDKQIDDVDDENSSKEDKKIDDVDDENSSKEDKKESFVEKDKKTGDEVDESDCKDREEIDDKDTKQIERRDENVEKQKEEICEENKPDVKVCDDTDDKMEVDDDCKLIEKVDTVKEKAKEEVDDDCKLIEKEDTVKEKAKEEVDDDCKLIEKEDSVKEKAKEEVDEKIEHVDTESKEINKRDEAGENMKADIDEKEDKMEISEDKVEKGDQEEKHKTTEDIREENIQKGERDYVQKGKTEGGKEKEGKGTEMKIVDETKEKDSSVSVSRKENTENKDKNVVSESKEGGKKQVEKSKEKGDVAGGLEMEVEDEEEEPPAVKAKVSAPPRTNESPLVIVDDDDDIICMGGTIKKQGLKRANDKSDGKKSIVIDLDDDDDDIEIETIKPRKKRRGTEPVRAVNCCNMECTYEDQTLQKAPIFVLTYYGRKFKKGSNEKVCGKCFERAVSHTEHLAYILEERQPLMDAKYPSRNDTVVLSDSDDDGEEEDECLTDDFMQYLRENLDAVLNETLDKYDMDFQINEAVRILTEKTSSLSVRMKEVDDTLDQAQKDIDRMRNSLYKDYTPTIRELPSLDIDDSYAGSREPVIKVTPSNRSGVARKQFSGPNRMTPHQMRITPMPHITSRQPPEPFRRSPLGGVATKKVTQVQRTVPPPIHQTESDEIQLEDDDYYFPPSPIRDELSLEVDNPIYVSGPRGLLSPGNDNPLCISPDLSPIKFRPSLPSSSPPLIQRQDDLAIVDDIEMTPVKPLPPVGALTRPRPHVGDVMYVMKLSFYGVWSRAKILEIVPKGTEMSSGNLSSTSIYKVKFESSYRKSNPVKQVTGKQMAYTTPCPVRFPVGTRVIAIFQDNDWSKECYYSGVIAEPPKSMNNFRYLVFFDDGYAQYVTHEKILLVCESSLNVWEDIHPDSREFIRKYLEVYPERPMVKLQTGQIVRTEWNGKWWIARVVEVDGSLVKMHFDADARTEWIYRGSTRLGPLYTELAHAAARKELGMFSRHRGLGVASLKKRNMPYVEYTRGIDVEEVHHDEQSGKSEAPPVRAVAKKSTTKRPDFMERGEYETPTFSMLDRPQPQGHVETVRLDIKDTCTKFRVHQCTPRCLLDTIYDPESLKGQNPLAQPMLCGWQRLIHRLRGGRRVVKYVAPCGRRLRNMEELHRYLRITESKMAVDLFDFDFWVHCFHEFILEKKFSHIKDLSYGAEYVPVPCVNSVDHTVPTYVSYSTKREPTEGVDLNLDPDFLTSCNCTDDCQDRDKCPCWQLTIQGTAYGPGGAVDPTVGYMYRRLPEPVMTGIYECNSKCKCSKTCLNRVAQQPLQLKLQVFKTERKGWGIRCINDIPQGGFICIYAGRLLTEQGANEGGKNYGDEYLAELDYIEVVEKLKDGYESDVVDDDSDCLEEKGSMEVRRSKDPESLSPALREHSRGSSENETEGELEEEEEYSQDARGESDEEFHFASWNRKRSDSNENSGYRTRLRNRDSRHGSSDGSQTGSRDKDKDSERGSIDDRDSRKGSRKKTTQSHTSSEHNASDGEEEGLRLPSRFAAVSEPMDEKSKAPKYRSVREFFGNDEYCYIMDAKNSGNIGRYLNHSCSPNVFVQNVFVDTHDLRFPWVAFFALTYIPAGTELTWDYNYDVGSVPGKILHCYCGSTDCRGRLL